MKRTVILLSLIFALAIALSVSIPTLAASSDNTTVSGNLGAKIEVTAPSAISLTLDPNASPATGTSATPGSVKSNRAWTVTVTGDETTMYSQAAPTTKLAAPFQVNLGSGLVDISTAPTCTGAKTSGTSITLSVSQAVSWLDDPASDYQIVLTFAGTN